VPSNPFQCSETAGFSLFMAYHTRNTFFHSTAWAHVGENAGLCLENSPRVSRHVHVFCREKRPTTGLQFSGAFQYEIDLGRRNTYIFDSFQPFGAVLRIWLNADVPKMAMSRAAP
jgi:hypothetical protein